MPSVTAEHQQDTFQQYLRQARALVAQAKGQTNPYLNDISPEEVCLSSEPTHGVVLIHGLLDSCVSMMSLKQYYANKGYMVRNILLPGHGTKPSDLIQVSWQEWFDTIEKAVNSFPSEIKHVAVAGLSAGGCLATYAGLALSRVTHVVAFAPAYGLGKLAEWLVPATQHWNGRCYPSMRKVWLTRKKESSPFRYYSIATNGVYQLLCLAAKLRQEIYVDGYDKPLLIVSSRDDETVSATAIDKMFASVRHPDSRHIIYSKHDNPIANNPRLHFRKGETYPNIISLSHTAMHIFPSHPYYGEKFYHSDAIYGALSYWNQCRYGRQFKRLTFNPDHLWLMEQLNHFF